MALVNHAKKEINVKLVFFGPSGSGKSTTLQYIYKKLKPDCRGQLKTLQTQGGKMLFFDFMPADLPSIEGYRARFHLYTLTGEPIDSPTWKMVLKGVDGVMFVADSTFSAMEGNLAGVTQVRSFLADNGKELADTPFVLQCNKQDQADVSSAQDIASALGLEGGATISTRALTGEGVLQGLSLFVKSVMKTLRENGPGTPPEEPEESTSEGETVSEDEETVRDVAVPPVDEAENFVEEMPAAGEIRVQLSGTPETAAGVVRIPLAVQCGGQEKRVTVTLAIALEQN